MNERIEYIGACFLLHNVYMYVYILGKEKAFFVTLSVLDQVMALSTVCARIRLASSELLGLSMVLSLDARS
jgi:hypothetical protein